MFSRRGFLLGAGATALSGCGTVNGIPNGFDDNFSVFLSDPHVHTNPNGESGPGWWDYTCAELADRVTAILAMRPRPRNVIIFGDLVFSHGEPEDYAAAKMILKPLCDTGITLTLGLGNHDRRNGFLAAFPEYGKSSPVPGRVVSIVNLGSSDLILLDSLKARDDETGAGSPVGGELNAAQQEWFADFIMTRTRPTFVAAHHNHRELTVCGKPMLHYLRAAPQVMGWINGHDHVWTKEPLVGWGDGNEKTLRAICLPSSGLWGDIGFVTFRTFPTEAVAELTQLDYWFNSPVLKGEKRPETWSAIVEENRGQSCRFPFEAPFRK